MISDTPHDSTLQSLNLPGSIQALEAPIGLPPSLLKKAEEVRTERGPVKLRSMMQDIRRVAQMDRQILDEVCVPILACSGLHEPDTGDQRL
jgi:ALIX V-shaped domain binding to HIV